MDFEEKREALAAYLDLDLEEVVYNPASEDYGYGYGTEFFTPEGTYRVYDEDEATQGVKDDIENLVDDIGLDAFSKPFQEWILENGLDGGYFEQTYKDDCHQYAESLGEDANDEYGNDLNKECIDQGLISGFDVVDGEYIGDSDLVELLEDYLFNSGKEFFGGNFAAWAQDTFGSDWVKESFTDGYATLDYDTIAEELISQDGYGPTLSSWDGQEHDLDNGYMAFKEDENDRRDEVSE